MDLSFKKLRGFASGQSCADKWRWKVVLSAGGNDCIPVLYKRISVGLQSKQLSFQDLSLSDKILLSDQHISLTIAKTVLLFYT